VLLLLPYSTRLQKSCTRLCSFPFLIAQSVVPCGLRLAAHRLALQYRTTPSRASCPLPPLLACLRIVRAPSLGRQVRLILWAKRMLIPYHDSTIQQSFYMYSADTGVSTDPYRDTQLSAGARLGSWATTRDDQVAWRSRLRLLIYEANIGR
jgi:hypothetical protein